MSANAFDIRTVLLARHAQHVVLIHFPIALFTTAVGLDFLSQWTKREVVASAAYCNFLLAAISTLPVVASGRAAWQWALEGQKLKGILLMHLAFGCLSAVLICAICWMHIRARRNPTVAPHRLRFGIEALAVLVVAAASHLGGFLTGVNG